MMIEQILLEFLETELSEVHIGLEKPETEKGKTKITEYVLIDKTGSGKRNYVKSSVIAFQSYALTLYEAAKLNERVKKSVEKLITLNEISSVCLNSDYNFTDTTTKQFRYQAVFDIYHY